MSILEDFGQIEEENSSAAVDTVSSDEGDKFLKYKHSPMISHSPVNSTEISTAAQTTSENQSMKHFFIGNKFAKSKTLSIDFVSGFNRQPSPNVLSRAVTNPPSQMLTSRLST